jgi:hypothetical protein
MIVRENHFVLCFVKDRISEAKKRLRFLVFKLEDHTINCDNKKSRPYFEAA